MKRLTLMYYLTLELGINLCGGWNVGLLFSITECESDHKWKNEPLHS